MWWVPKKKYFSYQIPFSTPNYLPRKFLNWQSCAKLAIRKLKINSLVVSLIEIDPKFTTKTFKYTTTQQPTGIKCNSSMI